MSDNSKKWFSLNLNSKTKQSTGSCGCGSTTGGCGSSTNDHHISDKKFDEEVLTAIGEEKKKDGFDQVFEVKMDRRTAFKQLTASLMIGAGAVSTSCSVIAGDETKEKSQIDWEEQFKGNYKLMTDEEKNGTVERLVRSYQIRTGKTVNMSSQNAEENVLFGYAFNISKCQGYMDCVSACVEENNQDRNSQMQYIRIHEMKDGNGFKFLRKDIFTWELSVFIVITLLV